MSNDPRSIIDDATDDVGPFESDTDRSTVSRARAVLQRAVESGALAGVSGILCVLDGRRAFRRGEEERGLVSLLLGGLFVAVAVTQRRSADEESNRIGLEQVPVVGSSSDTDDATADSAITPEPEGDVGETDDGETDDDETETDDGETEADSIGDPETADDALEDAESTSESSVEETRSGAGPVVESEADDLESADAEDEDETETESADLEEPTLERIGEAAFDRKSGEIPVPQRVFNNNVLSLNAEAYWGIREADDAVVVSELFDPIQDGDGIRYVASTQIDGDRMLTVPDTVLNHWDGVAGGGTAVASGDGLVFGIDDSLRSDGRLLVVPAVWADDLLSEGE
ncbi:hypothetical protein OB955_09545 [Halobacteria archaeon AArc-m2/3/4]|uniref:Uncharacterized protein n=1 Tax=Natronoglomus mannanivorans TaxID=2979990 RepID=A0ABT2QDI8_9EURY|nr:hypothetical protein [Halobacteria archaeon AArc-m2/3/4]